MALKSPGICTFTIDESSAPGTWQSETCCPCETTPAPSATVRPMPSPIIPVPPPPPPVPVANFTGSPLSGTQPLTVDFIDTSTNSPTSWLWDFGDGIGTSTLQNPSYTYNVEGSYTVSLTASNIGGSTTETKISYITVTLPAPVADFVGVPVTGEEALTVNFTDLSTNSPATWLWDFGDGVGTSTLQNATYTYTTAGTYTVSLTVTNSGGTDEEEKIDYITVTGGDPYWNYVSLLLPLNGTPGSLLLEDFSQYEQDKLILNDMEYSTTDPKFGTASLLSTTLDCVSEAFVGTQFNRITGEPMTIEFFYKWVSSDANSSANPVILRFEEPSSIAGYVVFAKYSNTLDQMLVRVGNTFHYPSIPLSSWLHVAFTVDSSDVYNVWINGVSVASGIYAIALNNVEVNLGNITGGSADACESYIDEVRITVGVDRYTGPFTPPTGPFPIG